MGKKAEAGGTQQISKSFGILQSGMKGAEGRYDNESENHEQHRVIFHCFTKQKNQRKQKNGQIKGPKQTERGTFQLAV